MTSLEKLNHYTDTSNEIVRNFEERWSVTGARGIYKIDDRIVIFFHKKVYVKYIDSFDGKEVEKPFNDCSRLVKLICFTAMPELAKEVVKNYDEMMNLIETKVKDTILLMQRYV